MDPLIVHTDHQLLLRRFRTVLILHGVLTGVLLVAIAVLTVTGSALAQYLAPVLVILVAGEVFQIGLHCFIWGSRLAVGTPVTVGTRGLEFQTPSGQLTLPWSAVPEVRVHTVARQQVATFVIHPQAELGQDGVEGPPTTWAQLKAKGVQLGNTGLTPGFEVILPAVQHFSQGRTRIV